MSADEMFKKLGYKKAEIGCFIQYNIVDDEISLNFDLDNKTVSKTKGYKDNIPITMQELQAINKKVEELGWIKN